MCGGGIGRKSVKLVIDRAEHVLYMSEILSIPALGDRKYLALGKLDDARCGILLGIRLVIYLRTDVDELTKRTLFLDYPCIILDVERTRNDLRERFDIILTAALVVDTLLHERVYERYDVDLAVRHKQLRCGKVDLLMLGDIEILRLDDICDLVYGRRINEYRAEKGLLRDEGEG